MLPTNSHLLPHNGPRPTSSSAERRIYACLQSTLPPGWTCWHSLRLLSWDGTVHKTEAECDFVFAVPGRGLLLLEVKGGQVRCERGRWYQGERLMDQAPKEQAHRARRILLERLRHEAQRGEVPVAIAVAFPDTAFENAPPHADLTDVVIGRHHLSALGTRLEEIVARTLVPTTASRESWWQTRVHAWWGESWVPRVGLRKQLAVRGAEVVQLGDAQIALLDRLAKSRRLHVQGGPGTGKTLLARHVAARWRGEGLAPLYLCYTRGLASSLREGGFAEAFAVRELAKSLVAEAGLPLVSAGPEAGWSQEDWRTVMMQAAQDALPALRREPVPVVVDEAQDFEDVDWDLVRALVGNERLYVFSDPGQSFWERAPIPEDIAPSALYELDVPYRCPASIQSFASQYRDAPTAAHPAAPSSEELQVVTVDDEAAALAFVGTEIRRLLKGGAHEDDILVLGLGGVGRSTVANATELGHVRAVRVDDPSASEGLVADTFLRCKGLERPIVFVTELGLGRTRYDVRMHIALTRATARCIVVATKDDVYRDPRLRDAACRPSGG